MRTTPDMGASYQVANVGVKHWACPSGFKCLWFIFVIHQDCFANTTQTCEDHILCDLFLLQKLLELLNLFRSAYPLIFGTCGVYYSLPMWRVD